MLGRSIVCNPTETVLDAVVPGGLDSSGQLVIIESSVVASAGKTELTTVLQVWTELMVVEFSIAGLVWLVAKELIKLSVLDTGIV